MTNELIWVKELETYPDEESYLYFVCDISFHLLMEGVGKRTKLQEPVALYINKKKGYSISYVSQDEARGKFGYDLFMDEVKFNNYLKEIKEVFKEAEIFRKKIDKINLENISIKDMIEIFTKDVSTFINARILAYQAVHSYSWKIEESLKEGLLKYISKENINKLLDPLTLQEERNGLEDERYNWLKNIIIPLLGKQIKSNEINEGDAFFEKIKKHLKKYKSYPSGFDISEWNMNYYLKTLKEDLDMGKEFIEKEFLKLKNKKEINIDKKQKIIDEYKINKDLIKQANIMGKLAELRLDLRVLGWSYYLHIYCRLLDICAKRSGLSKGEIGNLTYHEVVKLLKNDLNVDNELKKNIKKVGDKNILIIFTKEKGSEVLLGNEADEKFYSVVEEKKELGEIEEFRGEIACRKGVVRGRVFTFRYGSSDFIKKISQFPEGSILVSNLTLPILMPAIRKSKAIITDRGGITCHAAIVSRELGIPCIIGTDIATKVLEDGDLVEVDTNKGVIRILE